jgi:hypothetical protein
MSKQEFDDKIGDGAFVYVGKPTKEGLTPGQTGVALLPIHENGDASIVAYFVPHGTLEEHPIRSSYDLWSGFYDFGDGTVWNQLNHMYRHIKNA